MYKFTFITGYRGSGKDTFYHTRNSLNSSNWYVYARNRNTELFIDNLAERLSFADSLKRDVHKTLGISTPDDTKKDSLIISGRTLRDHYIEASRKARDIDPDIYARELRKRWDGNPVVITDWRYPNEYNYLSRYGSVQSIRIFRKNVPIPPDNVESEHSLDNVKTDFLILTDEKDFPYAVKQFPQYWNYHKTYNQPYLTGANSVENFFNI